MSNVDSQTALPTTFIASKKGVNRVFSLIIGNTQEIDITNLKLNADIKDLLSLLSDVIAVYACSEVATVDGYVKLENPSYAFAFKSKPTNFNELTYQFAKIGDVELKMLIIQDAASKYISVYKKFAADPEASQFVKSETSLAVCAVSMFGSTTYKLVTTSVNHEARRAISRNALEIHAPPVATPAISSAISDEIAIALPAKAAWVGKKAATKPLVTETKSLVATTKSLVATSKPATASVDSFRVYMKSMGLEAYQMDEDRDDLASCVGKKGYLSLLNQGRNTMFWSPIHCPQGKCSRESQGRNCDNISCSYHSGEEIVARCVRVSKQKIGANQFVDNVRAQIAAECYLFHKKVEDPVLISDIYRTSIEYIPDRSLTDLLNPYAVTY
jgi:hypothetical protein